MRQRLRPRSASPPRGGGAAQCHASSASRRRYRRLRVALGLVVVLALVGFVAVRVTTAGQTFDPALDPEFAPGGEAPVDDASDGGLPGEG